MLTHTKKVKHKEIEIRNLLTSYAIVEQNDQDEFMEKLFKILGVLK